LEDIPRLGGYSRPARIPSGCRHSTTSESQGVELVRGLGGIPIVSPSGNSATVSVGDGDRSPLRTGSATDKSSIGRPAGGVRSVRKDPVRKDVCWAAAPLLPDNETSTRSIFGDGKRKWLARDADGRSVCR